MTWTAWNNGTYEPSGNGYGFKISFEDRQEHFEREWKSITIILPPDNIEVTANVDKKSFWTPTCGELVSKKVGTWLINRQLSPWPKGKPPKFNVSIVGDRRFKVKQ
jgi:hypothetical protein